VCDRSTRAGARLDHTWRRIIDVLGQTAIVSPVFFLLLSLAFTSVTLAAILFTAWRTLGRAPHALSWAIAFSIGAVQWTGNLCRDFFPNKDVYWIVVGALALASAAFGLRGHLQRTGHGAATVLLTVPTGLCFGILAIVTFVLPHFGLKLALTPIFAATTLFASAWLVWHHRKRPLPAEKGATIALGLFGAFQAAAAIAALMNGSEPNPALIAVYTQINFLAMPALYTAVGLFVVFILASDLAEVMREAAVSDQLTGLLNRRGLGEAGAKAYATARRTGRPVSVIMTDIDHFKDINDSFGHIIGDQAISHFAAVLQASRRNEDVVARVGGEEFAMILPGADIEESLEIASGLCEALSATPLRLEDAVVEMTASFGVATLSDTDTCLSDAIARADSALYQSKEKGRNRVDLESSAVTLLPDGSLLRAMRRLAGQPG